MNKKIIYFPNLLFKLSFIPLLAYFCYLLNAKVMTSTNEIGIIFCLIFSLALFLGLMSAFIALLVREYSHNELVRCKNTQCGTIFRKHQLEEVEIDARMVISKEKIKERYCLKCDHSIKKIKSEERTKWMKNNPDFPTLLMFEDIYEFFKNYFKISSEIRKIEKVANELYEYKTYVEYYKIEKNIPNKSEVLVKNTEEVEKSLMEQLDTLISSSKKNEKERLELVKEKLLKV